MRPRSGGSVIRRGAWFTVVAILALALPVAAAGAEPRATSVAAPPDPNPTTPTTPCVRTDRCRPIGELTADPGLGVVSTVITLDGSCGRALGTSPFSGVTVGISGAGFDIALNNTPGIRPTLRLDSARGTFVFDPFSFESIGAGPFVTPGVYYFDAYCYIYEADEQPGTSWQTPPASFCLYAPDDDPAGCTATGLEHYGLQIGAWGSFAGQFIEQIGEQFKLPDAPAPDAPELTTTTRRGTQGPPVTSPAPPPPPPPTTTSTTKCDPNPKPPPKCK